MVVIEDTSDSDWVYRPSQDKRSMSLNKAQYSRKKTPVGTHNHASSSNPKKRRNRCSVGSVYDTTCEAQRAVFERAKEVLDSLSPQHPSFVKCMLPSHVSGGFWLGLPREFCHLHLPKSDITIDLEDETGELYPTVYLPRKLGLSGGWMGFSKAHNLNVMDVLVFRLVQPSKFKVYIIRSQGSDEMGGVLGLLKLNDCSKQNDEVDGAIDTTQGNGPNTSTTMIGPTVSPPDQLENASSSEDLCSEEVWDGIRFSESVISFKEVTDFENFSIVVDGLVIDSELPKHVRSKYYELCCSQGSYLHEHLIEGLNCKLVSGMISQTINIVDSINAINIGATSPDSLVLWSKTLEAFELMGMNVSFLLNRLQQLMEIVLKSKRYKEARIEREHAQEELRSIETKLVELKETINRLDEEIVDIDPQRMEVMFQQLTNVPW